MDTYNGIYAIVARIPPGRVATYGQIARMAGRPRDARQVGYALAATPDKLEIPWHRVINASGGISSRSEPGGEQLQRALLEQEGVVFDDRGRVALMRFQWDPRAETEPADTSRSPG